MKFSPSKNIYIPVLLVVSLLAGCASPLDIPTTVTPEAVVETTSSIGIERAPEIRFGILEDISATNVWAIYGRSGSGYWNQAVQGAYWPHLYQLNSSPLGYVPQVADGFPGEFVQEGSYVTATILLRDGLTWTDGEELTASDVAFTGNTALAYQLKNDWQIYYNPLVLDHIEAAGRYQVKYYFTQAPAVSDWYYGILLAPIVQEGYWKPFVDDITRLIPDETLRAEIAAYEARVAGLQAIVDQEQLAIAYGYEEGPTNANLTKNEEELIYILNELRELQDTYELRLDTARQVLFSIDNQEEPSLGPWKFQQRETGLSIVNGFNQEYFGSNTVAASYANGAYILSNSENTETLAAYGQVDGEATLVYHVGPFFERSVYLVYSSEDAALDALRRGEVEAVLSQQGLSKEAVVQFQADPGINVAGNERRSLRYLAFNLSRTYFSRAAFRQAVACTLDLSDLAQNELAGDISIASGYVSPHDIFWSNPGGILPCVGDTEQERFEQAAALLGEAGFDWQQKPAWNQSENTPIPGQGLVLPEGVYFPQITLLAPTVDHDPVRAMAAQEIVHSLQNLGIPVKLELKAYQDVIVDVYGTKNYDLVLLGGRLGYFPDYLCAFSRAQDILVEDACGGFLSTSSLDDARQQAFHLQELLVSEVPFIPLYYPVTYDVFRDIQYPFVEVQDGLTSGLHGAADIAQPVISP
ncbi:MAG: hypothetical protein JXA13_10400 [Anaerolineales bacterium]|nr:hypothetical protein [Anaerolineales bacterium]